MVQKHHNILRRIFLNNPKINNFIPNISIRVSPDGMRENNNSEEWFEDRRTDVVAAVD